MIRALDARQQRQLAIALLGAALVGLLSVTVLPVWLVNAAYQERIDTLGSRLQAYARVTERDAGLVPRFEALKRAQLSGGHYLRSETAAVAGAELQSLVKKIAGANGSQILSTQILPAVPEDGFVRVTLKLRMRGELESVLKSLHALESASVFLFIDKLSLRDSGIRARPRQVIVKPMDADFDLVAYMPEQP